MVILWHEKEKNEQKCSNKYEEYLFVRGNKTMKELILAIETGGTKIQLVLGDKNGEILYRYRAKVEREKGFRGILDTVLSSIPHMSEKAKELSGKIWRIGIGFGGPVETATGTAIWSAQIEGWKDFSVTKFFEKKTGLPTFLFNDSNAAAWGEYCKGVGNNCQVFFYTNIGSGVGGGVVINGQLFDGQGRGAAEIGQTYMYDPRNQNHSRFKCNHIERYCSGWSIQERIRNDEEELKKSLLWKLCDGDREKITCELWSEGVKAGDAFSLKILDEEAEFFAIALCNMICFYSPQIIAIGGGVSLIGDPLIDRIRKYTEQYVYLNSKGTYQIVKSSLDEDVVLVGTLLLTAAK